MRGGGGGGAQGRRGEELRDIWEGEMSGKHVHVACYSNPALQLFKLNAKSACERGREGGGE